MFDQKASQFGYGDELLSFLDQQRFQENYSFMILAVGSWICQISEIGLDGQSVCFFMYNPASFGKYVQNRGNRYEKICYGCRGQLAFADSV